MTTLSDAGPPQGAKAPGTGAAGAPPPSGGSAVREATSVGVVSGTVYGPLLNFQREWDLGLSTMAEPPYKGSPQAPVLYIKTANTFSASETNIPVPARVPAVEIGATIGMVFAKAWPAVGEDAQTASLVDVISGLVLLNDLSVPHSIADQGFYRPPVKYKCLDGFLGVGPALLPLAQAPMVSQFVLEVLVNGAVVQSVNFDQLLRSPEQLARACGEFMQFLPGDVLMLGCDCLDSGQRPRAQVGDRIELRCAGFASAIHTLVAEEAA